MKVIKLNLKEKEQKRKVQNVLKNLWMVVVVAAEDSQIRDVVITNTKKQYEWFLKKAEDIYNNSSFRKAFSSLLNDGKEPEEEIINDYIVVGWQGVRLNETPYKKMRSQKESLNYSNIQEAKRLIQKKQEDEKKREEKRWLSRMKLEDLYFVRAETVGKAKAYSPAYCEFFSNKKEAKAEFAELKRHEDKWANVSIYKGLELKQDLFFLSDSPCLEDE